MVGILQRLSHACRRALRLRAVVDFLADVYDNINPSLKVAQQVLGRKDSVESGTCATAFVLYDAKAEDMQTDTYLEHIVNAKPLTEVDINLTAEEGRFLRTLFEHAILRIIVAFGGDKFAKFKTAVKDSTPSTELLIPPHQTEYYPLPTMHIDESSTTGNADVVKEIFREQGLDVTNPDHWKVVKILAGDQLSVA